MRILTVLLLLLVGCFFMFSNSVMAVDFGQDFEKISASGPQGPSPSEPNSPGPAPNSGDGISDGSGF